ncbi:MAG: UMP kinase [Gammaproteobacteria bacterium]|jgi:uridylate kinase|nr:UMP kinase [Gammaproteobacteria bacterium]
MPESDLRYRRILLKLSGEALMGAGETGIDPLVLAQFAAEIHELVQAGAQVGLVVGGGNIFRGAGLAAAGMDRVTGDHMGMLATVMNALAMQDALRRLGTEGRVMSALSIASACEDYSRARALRHLDKGRVVLFAAGTGNPFFTTDSAAGLRAIEIGADIMFKATQVDGVYSADPKKDPDARRFDRLSYDEALRRQLMVMDHTAIILCRDHGMPLMVFDIHRRGNLMRAARGEAVGTLVEKE